LARAHRVSALVALEEGDYDRAVRELTTAAKLGEQTDDLPELLRIAKDLQARAAKAAKPKTRDGRKSGTSRR
jgi:uncharacterized protein HemY